MITTASIALAQITSPPAIEWQRSFGGTNDDYLKSLRQESDGGFIVGGESLSGINGNKTSQSFGSADFWVVRLDAQGNEVWDQSLGGSDYDELASVVQTSDGGRLLAGFSSSTNGDKTAPAYGLFDFWLVRLDASNNKIWDRSFGGSGNDYLRALEPVSDGGFIVAGDSWNTTNGNKLSPSFGGPDFWVVRLSSEGEKVWEASFGGTGNDVPRSIVPLSTVAFWSLDQSQLGW